MPTASARDAMTIRQKKRQSASDTPRPARIAGFDGAGAGASPAQEGRCFLSRKSIRSAADPRRGPVRGRAPPPDAAVDPKLATIGLETTVAPPLPGLQNEMRPFERRGADPEIRTSPTGETWSRVPVPSAARASILNDRPEGPDGDIEVPKRAAPLRRLDQALVLLLINPRAQLMAAGDVRSAALVRVARQMARARAERPIPRGPKSRRRAKAFRLRTQTREAGFNR